MTSWMDVDAKHDAHQARLLAEARGQRIANPAAWEAKARWRFRKDTLEAHHRESAAMAKFVMGGHSDLYGRVEVPTNGDEYRDYIRQQKRAAAARRRAKGIKRNGRDG